MIKRRGFGEKTSKDDERKLRLNREKIRLMITLTNVSFGDEVLKSIQLVLVEFYADWSGSHHIISPGLIELNDRYGSRVKFCMVDVGNHKELSEKYGIWNIPTIVFFKNGHPVDYIVGLVPKVVIAQKLDALLEP